MNKIRHRSERRKEHVEDKSDKVLNKEPKENHLSLLFALLVVRLLNIFGIRTSFVPDEYWQSLEVAYHYVYGLSYITWEWQVGLRSFAYPGIFALLYKAMHVLGINNIQLHVFLPRLLQACLSAVGDWYFYRFARKYFGDFVAGTAMYSLMMSWFWWYCATRTILQTAESAMLCIGLYHYPFDHTTTSRSVLIYQVIAVTVSAIRPTAAVVWVPMALWHIKKEMRIRNIIPVIFRYVYVSAVILAFLALIDRLYYGTWVFVQWNFLHFNVITNQGVIFGRNPWYYYFIEGIPVVIGTQLIFFLHGLFVYQRSKRSNAILTCCIGLFLLNIFVYSCIGHKEIKFIIHLIPIAALFCGISLSQMSPKLRKYSLVFLAITNIPAGMYFGLIHQGGTLSIMAKLHDSVSVKCDKGCGGDVLFLVPCYSTPLQSHLHLNITVRMLTCPPNLVHIDDYIDETDLFYQDPKNWLQYNVLTRNDNELTFVPPHHIVIFDVLYEKLKNWNFFVDYSVCASVFHTHFPERRTGKYILLLCHL